MREVAGEGAMTPRDIIAKWIEDHADNINDGYMTADPMGYADHILEALDLGGFGAFDLDGLKANFASVHGTELKRLRQKISTLDVMAEVGFNGRMNLAEEIAKLEAEIDRTKELRAEIVRLRAAISTHYCPQPSNSVPKNIAEWTVSDCMKAGECGCILGLAFKGSP
jgi:hypothetical protein